MNDFDCRPRRVLDKLKKMRHCLFFTIEINEEQAREILKSEDHCSVCQGGNLDFLLMQIKKTFPALAEEYSYLFEEYA